MENYNTSMIEYFANRLNTPSVSRVYAQIIRKEELSIVNDLMKNLKQYASNHEKYIDLVGIYKERFGHDYT
jgi:flagellar biosynthesis/type III secretory pathway ATPase